MPGYSNDPSHDNTSDAWSSLAALMAQVQNIMTTLDDATQHITFHDGTMLSFVFQLNTIKDNIPDCTPQNYHAKTKPMMKDLRNACTQLNLAAVEYKKRQCQNPAFYTHMTKATECLSELLDRWNHLSKSLKGQ